MRQAFANATLAVGELDERLVLLVGDISHGILRPFAERFPDRYYNVGICEPTIVNMAAGLSHVGLIPVVHTIAPFLIERSFEQIKLDFGYQQRSVNLISVGSAFDYAQLGCSHHCYDDLALLSQFENARIFVPGTAAEFAAQFKTWYQRPGINYFRLSEFPHDREVLASGPGCVRARGGDDVTIVALGPRLEAAMNASEDLASEGVDADVLYISVFKPLDPAMIIESVQRTGRLVTVEEHSAHGGLGDECLKALQGHEFAFRSLAICGFIHTYGTHAQLCDEAGISSRDIAEAALTMVRSP